MRFIGNSCDVLIGGAGIAAAASALRLCALGFRPLMLATSRRILPGVEAIPEAAYTLFKALGVEHVLWEAGAVLVEGFENRWDPGKPMLRSGHWIHVDRERLARAAVREAVKRGADFQVCRKLPQLRQQADSVCASYDGAEFPFDAAIDATGRSAVWSRPIRRRGRQVADMYRLPSDVNPAPARVVQFPGRWAYRIGVPARSTMAILSPDGTKGDPFDSLTREAFCVSPNSCTYAGRRPAFPQWSEHPVRGRRLAVGDAALAYDPLAGQGIRFALSSAFAAASVINTWRTVPSQAAAAERFYGGFVARCREMHFQFIDQLRGEPLPTQQREAIPELVVFSGRTVISEVQVDSRIRTEEVVVLADGDCVRWVEGLDLLRLRDLVSQPIHLSDLADRMVPAFCGVERFTALMQWCLQHRVLSAACAGTSFEP
jgi:flavin-dependent dehydrogenase